VTLHHTDKSGREGMAPFQSVLFDDTDVAVEREAPAFFADLNLDQLVASVTAGRERYDLAPFFHTRLATVDAIAYRHEVLRDLEGEELFAAIAAFAERMRDTREQLAHVEKLRHGYEQEAWFVDAVQAYLDAVHRLADDLAGVELRSRGMLAFRDYLAAYCGSDGFTTLVTESERVREGLAGVRYSLLIKGSHVKVDRYESEPDYSVEVERTFEKFKQGAVEDHRTDVSVSPWMNHVEARVLELVARLHPEVFSALDAFCECHRDYVDGRVGRFDREVQFYVAYLEYVGRLRAAGLAFCYPRVSDRSKEVWARDTFDIALANALVPKGAAVVSNDFRLEEQERIIVVSGPNQGGKTTFARTFGQLHHLASLGCLVPGSEAQLHKFDQLFTHFEREEDITSLSGKLEDDLVRIHDILERASTDSIVIMNESFTSTTLHDALLLGTAVMEQMIRLDLLCVYVTFVDELASLGETTVSMVSTVVPDDPASRTYKLERRPADGLAFAAAIAEKYGLTYDRLKERTAS